MPLGQKGTEVARAFIAPTVGSDPWNTSAIERGIYQKTLSIYHLLIYQNQEVVTRC